MSELMKSIVEEVLNKKGNGSDQPTPSIQTQTTINNPSVSKEQNKQDSKESGASLAELRRPNYQRMKKDQRLSAYEQTPKPKPKQQTQTNYQKPNNLDKELLSKLSAISLAQGKVERQVNVNNTHRHKMNQSPKLLGKTKDKSYIWYFPYVSDQLAQKFKRSPDGGAVGVITSKNCFPSQLLIVNDVMRENQDVKYHLTWDRNGQETFVWELYDQDATRLEKKLLTILQILNRKATKVVDSYTVMSPSAWLSKQLNIGKSVEAISVLEGIPYYASLLLLEQHFSTNEQISFQYEIESNYLILCGAHNVVSKVVQDFRRKTENLL